mmetsp:Transcript_48480/g.96475  ORF Transcript_48480/g.96475 Transcript_48480/m.96475 type:complete len:574 (+) Transcript_48480:100-1821(+)|eukprot:CAMPEP_0172674864 /NCGR_PEP_ID=MMETSP1074-20121228/12965_1 /TAXON_ID=2916 /ORGANISM="Ceratium fusus, Strain PA161109" /LENGTH=573 /DNA_ID=CAMNT_0013492307 /DNA_START=100 /DNA_END=1821 /DNA_ORIENTATION=+
MFMYLDAVTTAVGFAAGTLATIVKRLLIIKSYCKDAKIQSPVDMESSSPEPVPEPLTDIECAEFEARVAATRLLNIRRFAGIVVFLPLTLWALWLCRGDGEATSMIHNESTTAKDALSSAEDITSVKMDSFASSLDGNNRNLVMPLTPLDRNKGAFATEKEDDYIGGRQTVSVNLTRQQMAIQTVGADMYYKSAYWSEIKLGMPQESYRVVFDTGSGHLILPSMYCRSKTCRAHKRYRRGASFSAKDINSDGTVVNPGEPRDQITVSFGTGEVTGVFVEETVCMQEPQQTGLFISTQLCMSMRMIAATEMSAEPFQTFDFDGVVGLGLPGLSETKEFNFIDIFAGSAMKSGNKHPHRFAVFLGEHEAETSEITFGGYAPKHAESKLAWNPVWRPELGHWMLNVKSMHVDENDVNFCREGCRVAMDTGTSLLAVPTAGFPEFYELLRHEADPITECHGSGPKLHIELEKFTITLDPRDYSSLEQDNGVSPLPETSFQAAMGQQEDDPEMCRPLLMSMDMPEPIGPKLFVLGEPVLRKYYTVYDADRNQPRVGLSKALHTGQPLHLDVDAWWYEE